MIKIARYTIFIDVDKCTGCYNCFLACRDEFYNNDYPPYSAGQPLNGHFWMQIKQVERGQYPKPKLDYIPVPCMHCQEAPCIEVAKDGAVYRRDDGIVIIDPEKAKGQKQIVNSCPYRVIFWNEEKQLPQKCTLCAHMLDQGEKEPKCVEACPTEALVFGDLDDPESEVSKLVAGSEAEVFHPEYEVEPLVKYSGLPKQFIAGEVVFADNPGECASGVKVSLTGNGVNMDTESNVFGDFEFEGLDKKTQYTLTIDHDGYRPWQLKVITHKSVNIGEVVLEPLDG